MKRARHQISRAACNERDEAGVDPFVFLPRDVALAIVDLVAAGEERPFFTLYAVLGRVNRVWCDVARALPYLSTTPERAAGLFFTTAQGAVDDNPVIYDVYFNEDRLRSDLVRLDCPLGHRCYGSHLAVVYSLCILLIRLTPLLPQDALTLADLFVLERAVNRAPYHWKRICAPYLSTHPAKGAPLQNLFLMVPQGGASEKVICVPLWELRARLRTAKTQCAVQKKTTYQTLGFCDGRRLMPANYERLSHSNQFSKTGARYCMQPFTALSVEQRVEFLAQHSDEINTQLADPAKIHRLCAVEPPAFMRLLDGPTRWFEEDCALVHQILLRLREQLIATDTPFARSVANHQGRKCNFCSEACIDKPDII